MWILVALTLVVIALLWTASGALMVLRPEKARGYFSWFLPEQRRKPIAVVALVIGGVLVFGAFSRSVAFWLPFVIGALSVAKGLYIFMADPKAVDQQFKMWTEGLNDEASRALGLLIFALGIALLFWLAGGLCPGSAGCITGPS